MFSNVWSVLAQYNTWLRLLHLLYDIEINMLFNVLYSDEIWFLTNQSMCRVLLDL